MFCCAISACDAVPKRDLRVVQVTFSLHFAIRTQPSRFSALSTNRHTALSTPAASSQALRMATARSFVSWASPHEARKSEISATYEPGRKSVFSLSTLAGVLCGRKFTEVSSWPARLTCWKRRGIHGAVTVQAKLTHFDVCRLRKTPNHFQTTSLVARM